MCPNFWLSESSDIGRLVMDSSRGCKIVFCSLFTSFYRLPPRRYPASNTNGQSFQLESECSISREDYYGTGVVVIEQPPNIIKTQPKHNTPNIWPSTFHVEVSPRREKVDERDDAPQYPGTWYLGVDRPYSTKRGSRTRSRLDRALV